ncbi:F-box/FBD/LRR-repeat protein At1g13570-like [Vicia villosa]|uniref:F-box/FBD/LRR-repeat protein At1g13570-like n=1 Tax=Vicia villosa TaxID=3911 RepID=UPI00273C5BF1|nr:F-box/FBD/LRR-repeat protein At1g13570-like [Vicia villosa]
METKRSKSTDGTVIDVEQDIISSLPDDVIDQILTHLPIRDAVRTSVLSNKWRYKWTTLPNLVFNRECVSEAFEDSLVIRRKLLTIIDHILLLHSGPINHFHLSHIGPISVTTLDKWILYLTRSSIKELELVIRGVAQPYKLPWCLFSCQSLQYIALYKCWLNPPSTIKGFRNLKILGLDKVTMTQDAFENLISGCPVLEVLRLMSLHGFTQVNIHAPKLKFFHIFGEFEGISFENTFQLEKVIVDLSKDMNSESNQSRLQGFSNSLLNFFIHLPHLRSLMIGRYFIKCLAAGVVPVKLPTPCINLSYLNLHVRFNNLMEISVLLCLLRSSPNLQKLELYAGKTTLLEPASYSWEDIFSGPTMPLRMRHVRLEGISGTKSQLDLIKFLLLYSPVLVQMIVNPVKNVNPELLTELIRFRRASVQVEVLYNV